MEGKILLALLLLAWIVLGYFHNKPKNGGKNAKEV